MWELVESIVYYFKYKKWPLPLLAVLILIALAFLWSAYDPGTASPVPVPSTTMTPVPTIPENQIKPVQKLVQNYQKHTYKESLNPKNDPENDRKAEIEPQGNVTHFKDTLIDTLKVEGLDPEITQKIFKHIRQQMDQQNPGYEIADSVRAALPDASDSEIYRITQLISNAASDSFDYMQHR